MARSAGHAARAARRRTSLHTSGRLGPVIAEKSLRGGGSSITLAAGSLSTGPRGHDRERRGKPMIPEITAPVSSRGADRA
ncbi:hypothetical protein SAURM35S_08354 [Streptomyces aurantiogriseus]